MPSTTLIKVCCTVHPLAIWHVDMDPTLKSNIKPFENDKDGLSFTLNYYQNIYKFQNRTIYISYEIRQI